MAKGVFEKIYASHLTADAIVAAEGLAQIDDDAQIAALVADVLTANPGPVGDYRGGKASAFGFLVGRVMKAAAGKANPKRVNEVLKKALDACSGSRVGADCMLSFCDQLDRDPSSLKAL